MDHKKSPIRRQKRTSKVLEDNFWDCSVCTYRNTAEAFKCSMCDVRKGTSTRKPRLNSALAAQQAATLPGASSTAAAAGSGSAAAAPLANGSASNNNNQHNNHSSPHNNHTTTNNHHSHSAAAAAAHNHSGGNNAGGSSHNSSSHHHHHHPKPPKVSRSKAKHKKYPARLTNVDRSTAQTREVTVNSVTVVITEYKPKVAKQPPSRRESSEQSMSESNDSRS